MDIRGMGAEGRAVQRTRHDSTVGVERRDDTEHRPKRAGRDGGADHVKEGVPSARRAQGATRDAEVRSEVDHASRSDGRGLERTMEQYREHVVRQGASEGTESPRRGSQASQTPRESAQATPRESAQGTPRESAQATPRESAEGTPRESAQGTPRESAQGTPRESAQGTPRESAQGTPRESAQGTPRESAQGTPRESAQAAKRHERPEHSPE